MKMSKFDIFTTDNVLHFLGGAALSSIVAVGFWHPWTLVFTVPIVITIEGLLREQAQSRTWNLGRWLTKHKITEGLMWGIGSAAIMATAFLLWR
jgi:hypothetical protein